MHTRHLKSNQKKQNKPVYLYVPQEPFTADCSLFVFFYPLTSQSSNFICPGGDDAVLFSAANTVLCG